MPFFFLINFNKVPGILVFHIILKGWIVLPLYYTLFWLQLKVLYLEEKFYLKINSFICQCIVMSCFFQMGQIAIRCFSCEPPKILIKNIAKKLLQNGYINLLSRSSLHVMYFHNPHPPPGFPGKRLVRIIPRLQFHELQKCLVS